MLGVQEVLYLPLLFILNVSLPAAMCQLSAFIGRAAAVSDQLTQGAEQERVHNAWISMAAWGKSFGSDTFSQTWRRDNCLPAAAGW